MLHSLPTPLRSSPIMIPLTLCQPLSPPCCSSSTLTFFLPHCLHPQYSHCLDSLLPHVSMARAFSSSMLCGNVILSESFSPISSKIPLSLLAFCPVLFFSSALSNTYSVHVFAYYMSPPLECNSALY